MNRYTILAALTLSLACGADGTDPRSEARVHGCTRCSMPSAVRRAMPSSLMR